MCQISGVVFRLVTIRCYRNTTNVRRSKESLDNTAHGDSSAATPCILPRSLSWIPTECFPGHPASCVWDSTSFSFSVERIIDRVFPVSGSPLVVFTTGIHTIRCLHVTAASHCTDGVFRPLWCSPSLDSSEVDAAALGQVLCQGVWLFTASCSSGGGGWHPPDGAFLLFGFRGVITSRPFKDLPQVRSHSSSLSQGPYDRRNDVAVPTSQTDHELFLVLYGYASLPFHRLHHHARSGPI